LGAFWVLAKVSESHVKKHYRGFSPKSHMAMANISPKKGSGEIGIYENQPNIRRSYSWQ